MTRLILFAMVLAWSSSAAAQATDPHAGHAMPAPTATSAANQTPAVITPVPPVTEADRAAAFPDVHGHAVHDTMWNYRVLFDQLEWQ
jgi:copper resistance protein B